MPISATFGNMYSTRVRERPRDPTPRPSYFPLTEPARQSMWRFLGRGVATRVARASLRGNATRVATCDVSASFGSVLARGFAATTAATTRTTTPSTPSSVVESCRELARGFAARGARGTPPSPRRDAAAYWAACARERPLGASASAAAAVARLRSPRAPSSLFPSRQRDRVGTRVASQRASRSYRAHVRYAPGSAMTGEHMLYAIALANVAVFAAWHNLDPRFMRANFLVSEESIKRGRWHTLLTSAFSHRDVSHLAANMLALYFFGREVARAGPGGAAEPVRRRRRRRERRERRVVRVQTRRARAEGTRDLPERRSVLGEQRRVPHDPARARRERRGQRDRPP